MTAAEFAAALKANGFRIVKAKIEDATGRCPGVSWTAVLRGRSAVDYPRTLAKVIKERDAGRLGAAVCMVSASTIRSCDVS
jgi:hypothetical protein